MAHEERDDGRARRVSKPAKTLLQKIQLLVVSGTCVPPKLIRSIEIRVEIQTPFRYMAPCFECEDLKNISEICTDRDDTRRSTQWGWNNLKGCGIGSCIDCKTEELTAEWQEHGSGWVKTLSGDTFIVCRECKTFKWDDSIEVCHVKLRQSKLCFECWDDKYKDWIEFGETLDAKWNLLHEKIAKMEVEIWEEMRNEEGRPVDKVAEPSWGDNEFDPINETPEFGIRYHARVETATSELSAKLSEYGKTRKWMENHVQGTATTDRPKDLEGIEIP